MGCAAEGAGGFDFVVEGIPFLGAIGVGAGLQQIDGFDKRAFPFVCGGAGGGVVQSVYKGAAEEFGDVWAADGVGDFGGVFPGQFAAFAVFGVDAVAVVGGVFDEQGLAAHAEFFVALAVVGVADFVAAQGVCRQRREGVCRGRRARLCQSGRLVR